MSQTNLIDFIERSAENEDFIEEIKYYPKPLDKITITFYVERFPQEKHEFYEASWVAEQLKKTNIPERSVIQLPKVESKKCLQKKLF